MFNNDGRYTDGMGGGDSMQIPSPKVSEARSAVHFLGNYQSDKTFCLIVSLVNPHDIWAYPGTGMAQQGKSPVWREAGYKLEDFNDMGIEFPPTINEDLSTKPLVQKNTVTLLDQVMGSLISEQEQ